MFGFGLGTFKYIPAQWFLFAAISAVGVKFNFFEYFIPTYLGAVASMMVFYYSSSILVNKFNQFVIAIIDFIFKNNNFSFKRRFNKMNRLMIKIKWNMNIYLFTFVAPLFLSIPLGSIACAKFYGHQKKTFPLMLINMAVYGIIMGIIVQLVNG
jgi:hypothetical protein